MVVINGVLISPSKSMITKCKKLLDTKKTALVNGISDEAFKKELKKINEFDENITVSEIITSSNYTVVTFTSSYTFESMCSIINHYCSIGPVMIANVIPVEVGEDKYTYFYRIILTNNGTTPVSNIGMLLTTIKNAKLDLQEKSGVLCFTDQANIGSIKMIKEPTRYSELFDAGVL